MAAVKWSHGRTPIILAANALVSSRLMRVKSIQTIMPG